jgi:hypothetical protein
MPDAHFLTERFIIFGFEFQNWMVIVVVGLALYALFVSFKSWGGRNSH